MWLCCLQYNRVINDMLEIFNSATICAYNEPLRCGLRLEPGELIFLLFHVYKILGPM